MAKDPWLFPAGTTMEALRTRLATTLPWRLMTMRTGIVEPARTVPAEDRATLDADVHDGRPVPAALALHAQAGRG